MIYKNQNIKASESGVGLPGPVFWRIYFFRKKVNRMTTVDNPKVLNSKRSMPGDLRAKIAELQSLYSHPERYNEISASITDAKSALCLVYISLYFPYWETEKLTKQLAQNAYAKNYQGGWSDVQEFLEYEGQTPEQFEAKYIERFGARDFYGNFLKKAERISRTIKVRDRNAKDTRPVSKPQFRRGYNDKGTLRLPHEYHGERPYRDNTDRVDRRSQVAHPLLRGN